jgi:hypothetical protein
MWPYIYAKLPQYTGTLSQAVPHDLVDDVVKVVGTKGRCTSTWSMSASARRGTSHA